MPLTRNYTTLLLYILLSILLLVLPLSNVAYAQSTTIPGPIEELVNGIQRDIDAFTEKIKQAFDEFIDENCDFRNEGPGQSSFCPIILKGRVDR